MSTVDIATARLDRELVAGVEELVNRVIWEDRPVVARFVARKDLASLSLRRAPTVGGPIRIVSVLGPPTDPDSLFDANPCGGTHVSATGQIGLLKVVGLEYRGEETRVEFLCGSRALGDYTVKHDALVGLARRLTVGYREVDGAVGRLEDEAKALRRKLRGVESRLAEAEARELTQAAEHRGSYRLVLRVLEARAPAELRALAQRLVGNPGLVALLASIGERSQLCFARADDVSLDTAAMMRQACQRLDGKGGGRPHFAQGSGRIAERSAVEAALGEIAAQVEPEGAP
jgi:alanyl-tRNA synthetase